MFWAGLEGKILFLSSILAYFLEYGAERRLDLSHPMSWVPLLTGTDPEAITHLLRRDHLAGRGGLGY